MTLKQKIEDYFQQNYLFAEGLAILVQSGVNTARYQRYLHTPFVPDSIIDYIDQDLTDLWERLPHEEAVISPVYVDVEVQKELTKSTPITRLTTPKNALPDAIRHLQQQARIFHKRQALVHAVMREASGQKDTGKTFLLAQEIMEEIVPSLDRIYSLIYAWQETGTLPTEINVNDAYRRGVEDYKKMLYLKQRISRLKGWLKRRTGAPQDRQNWQNELLEKEIELKDITEKLK